jgi:hypothetical protein
MDSLRTYIPAWICYLAVVAFGFTDFSLYYLGDTNSVTSQSISSVLLALSVIACCFHAVHYWGAFKSYTMTIVGVWFFIFLLVILGLTAAQLYGIGDNGMSYCILGCSLLIFLFTVYMIVQKLIKPKEPKLPAEESIEELYPPYVPPFIKL